jgi:hypothetical protein
MRNLTGYLRALGFRFGIYTAAGVNACDGAHGTHSSPGRYTHSDATLYISFVVLHTQYTKRRRNDLKVRA